MRGKVEIYTGPMREDFEKDLKYFYRFWCMTYSSSPFTALCRAYLGTMVDL